MRNLTSHLAIIVTFLSIHLFAQPAPRPLPPEAAPVFKAYEVDVARAKSVCDKSIDDAKTRTVRAVQPVLDKLTKAGRLDDAIAVKEAAAVLSPEQPATAGVGKGDLAKTLIGTKWFKQDLRSWTLTLLADGDLTASHHSAHGTWTVVGPGMIRVSSSMNDCHADLLKLSPDGKSLLDKDGKAMFVFKP